MVFEIEYPVTRTIRWKWLGPLSFGGAFIAIVLLTVLNVALVGYETINIFSNDYLTTQSQWYDKYMPYRKPKPGSLCDPHLFNVGDQFTTNYTIFDWAIQSVDTPNAASSGVTYSGSPLTACDVSLIYANGDLSRYSIDFSIVLACKDKEKFGVTATTSFAISSLPGIMPRMLGVARLSNADSLYTDARPVVVNELIRTAAEDVGRRAQTAFVVSSGASPILFSYIGSVDTPCPASNSSSACATQPPRINFVAAATVTGNGTLSQDVTDSFSAASQVIDPLMEAPLLNLFNTVYAAARIDIGIDTPNNFILHRESLPLVINKTFPVTTYTPATAPEALNSQLYTTWEQGYPDTNITQYLPITVDGAADIQLVYLCRYQRRKSVGSLIISVLVAVLSMFGSGWGVYMGLLTSVAKRNPGSNACEGHISEPYQKLHAANPEKYVE